MESEKSEKRIEIGSVGRKNERIWITLADKSFVCHNWIDSRRMDSRAGTTTTSKEDIEESGI